MRTQRTLESVNFHLKRLHSQLKRTVNAIDKYDRLRRRMVTGKVKVAPPPAAKVKLDFETPAPFPVPLDDTIPAILDRRSQATKDADRGRLLDLNAAEEIKAKQAVLKKQKAAGRIAKMKATQSGKTRRMPLQGKAALDFINQS